MSHSHHHHGEKNLKTAFLLNLLFTLIEIVGGLYTNSIAILSDALHDAGDCLSLGMSWYLQRVSKREADSTFTYGYQRFSPLGALLTGTVLLVGMVIILFQAVPRLMNPEPVQASGMIALAVIGIVVNGLAAWKSSKGSSLNEKVVSWHLLEDVLGWIAVLLGSIAIKVWDLPVIDPILSIGISLFILLNVGRNLGAVARVFLQGAPDGFKMEAFVADAYRIPMVRSIHHSHSWSLDGESHVLTLHLVMDSQTSRDHIGRAKREVHELVDNFNFVHVTIEVELEGESCCLAREPDRKHTEATDEKECHRA